jgi:hypothetical protein
MWIEEIIVINQCNRKRNRGLLSGTDRCVFQNSNNTPRPLSPQTGMSLTSLYASATVKLNLDMIASRA